jgi:hypothetical protein
MAYFKDAKYKESAVQYIKSNMQTDKNGNIYWNASKQSWSGKVESTCKAAKVMYFEDMAVFQKAFAHITSFIQNGRLYSTTDTCAFLDLLRVMKHGGSKKAMINGKVVEVDSAIECDEVTIIDEGLMVRKDYDKEIDYTEMDAGFEFSVKAPDQLQLGERAKIVIKPKEKTLCPIVKIFLPANLAFVKGGVNVQSGIFPIKTGQLELDVVAVRRGTAGMYAVLTDMYDAEKIGVSDRLQVVVN